MNQYDYLIVGSGITGSIFAHEAIKRGKSCLVIERRNHTGGNLYCENIEGIKIHKYGAHIFHTSNKKVWDYINQFAEFNNYINSPIANYHGEIYNLPFNMNTFSKMWNISSPDEAAIIIAQQQAEISGEPRNLEEQAIKLVGRDVFEKLIKGYTEKQWGRACQDLPPDIIKRIPVRYTYNNNYFNDYWQGIPLEGYNAIIEKLLVGSNVQLEVDYLKNKELFNQMANKIIYTGMIDEYFNYKLGELEYRSLRFESKVINKENYQGVAVVNYTDPVTSYTRIIEHKHFEFGSQPKTVITMEYPADWQPGMEAYYPVNNPINQALYKQYQHLAQQESSVIFCGRLGEYKYYDMDDAIAAILAITDMEL